MGVSTGELIWQGYLHLGDDPGVFGDATYVGLAVELPLTLTEVTGGGTVILVVCTENVQTLAPGRGHIVTVVSYTGDEVAVLGTAQITASPDNQIGTETEVRVDISTSQFPVFAGVRIHIDDSGVQPGLYDDFILTGLRLISPDNAIVGELGFRS